MSGASGGGSDGGGATVRVALVGLGKIARDQHLGAIARHPQLVLAATVDPHAAPLPGVPHFADLAELAAAGPGIDAVALCTPPQVRGPLAQRALAAGWHVLTEKPPAASMAEAAALAACAAPGQTLFAAWHSRYAPGMALARDWLAAHRLARVEIDWRESIRKWHPGQAWLGAPGGLGVFDPAINALSMLTALLPDAVAVAAAALHRPANWAMPIAGTVSARAGAVPVAMQLDFDWAGDERWDLRLAAEDGATLVLAAGGHAAWQDGAAVALPARAEYDGVYAHFAALIAAGASDFDAAPLAIALAAINGFPMAEVAAFSD